MKPLSFSVVIFILLSACVDSRLVHPDNPNIQYIGRLTVKRPVLSWPGSYIQFRFEGTKAAIVFEDESSDEQPNYFQVVIDGSVYAKLKVTQNESDYLLAEGLNNTEHHVKVFKCTESFVGATTFKGLILNGELLIPRALPKRKIEVIGDSWSCGYGNEVAIAPPPSGNPDTGFHSKNENNFYSYTNLLAQYLNAQCHVTAYSGKGVYRNFTGDTIATMPKLYEQTSINSEEKWEHKNYQPDLTLIFLGTNDFAMENKGVALDSSSFVTSYIKLVENVKAHHPDSEILLVYGNSITDAYPEGKFWLSRWRNYISAVKNEVLFEVHTHELPAQQAPYGEDWHPSKNTHQQIAKALTPVVQQLMHWD